MIISPKKIYAFIYDLCVIPIAWFGGYFLRFNFESIPAEFYHGAISVLPVVVLVQGSVQWYFGLYKGIWRFASVPDLVRIVRAVVVGAALTAVAVFLLTRFEGVPRSVFVMYAMLMILLMGGPRLGYRWWKDRTLYLRPGQNVMIVGAGSAGETLVRELRHAKPSSGQYRRASDPVYVPRIFVDDDPSKQGSEIHGLAVVGPVDKIPELVERYDIQQIFLAVPSADAGQMRRIVSYCEGANVSFRTLPNIRDIALGKITVNELREVAIEDLLGRESVELDWESIRAGLTEKTVLVSGGGGSIGSELCRQIMTVNPQRVVILERNENNLYCIERELKEANPEGEIEACLGDVGCTTTLKRVFDRFAPQVVFHAAAYKHVPMLEYQVREAVYNNVLATFALADFAIERGCEKFVLISTDKAVNPSNIMGATKRIAEMICQSLSQNTRTHFVTVRFGNVIGSAGSVLPLFKQQLSKGGPLTVTHPEITRYFMTIPEACQLIMQSGAMGNGGEIFVLDMGEPIKIAYLAEQLIRLSGKEPGEDIEIKYIGLRPGEKMHEELFHAGESLSNTQHSKILLAASRSVDVSVLKNSLAALREACDSYDESVLLAQLKTLVPEMQSVN